MRQENTVYGQLALTPIAQIKGENRLEISGIEFNQLLDYLQSHTGLSMKKMNSSSDRGIWEFEKEYAHEKCKDLGPVITESNLFEVTDRQKREFKIADGIGRAEQVEEFMKNLPGIEEFGEREGFQVSRSRW